MTPFLRIATTRQQAFICVILMRAMVREIAAARDHLHHQARAVLRQARKLRARGSPFDAARIEQMERHGHGFIDRAREHAESMKEWAENFLRFAPAIDAALTLDDRLAVLNANSADRDRLEEVDDFSTVTLIAVLGLEDSARYRGLAFKGGPMATALNLFMIDFLSNTDEGQGLARKQFEHGGLFASAPDHIKTSGGEIVRMARRLRVVTPPFNHIH